MHTVVTKARRQSAVNRKFIEETIQKDLRDGVIEPSTSPWRVQALGRQGKSSKENYSEAINKFTLLDGNALPNMQELVNKIAQYRHFSTLNLKSACHKIENTVEDRPYTAFETNGKP